MTTPGNDFVGGIRFPADIPGRERIRVLLLARGYSLASWARERGFFPQQVTMTLSGARPYPEIRDDLAAELGLSREEVDQLIDETPGKTPGAEAGARQVA